MKKLKLIVIIFSMFIVGMTSVNANSMKSIDIVGNIDDKGNVHITETWEMKTNKDTEVYKPIYNSGNITITDFKVKDEKRNYDFESDWDIDASFNDKKYKYGINYVDEGIELCFGISEYGNKTYTFSYTMNNVIFNTEDAQVLYLKFISDDMNTPPEKYSVVIKSEKYFEDTLDVWGYGSKSYTYVENGQINMSSVENTPLKKSEYGVLLAKFDKGTFDISEDNKYDNYKDFASVLNAAEKGTFKYNYKSSAIDIARTIGTIITYVGPFFFIIYLTAKGTQKYKFGPAGKKIDMKMINSFRDIPCDKDVFKAYFISEAYSLNKNKTDFLGTMFLKWINENKISHVKIDKKKLFGKNKEVNAIDLTNYTSSTSSTENDLFEMVSSASKDNLLEENEFQKYASVHNSKILSWFDKAEEYGRDLYIQKGLVSKEKGKYLISDEVKKDAIELAGLKKYLKEFTLIKEKQPIEVKLWKEYLMFAQIFGIANEVAKQFKDLYPEIVTEMDNVGYNVSDIILLNRLTTSAVRSASAARQAAMSYSSGGGGFSSGGGGGGSFGGGGGGTR